jgi:hypothetical protein
MEEDADLVNAFRELQTSVAALERCNKDLGKARR